MLETVLARVLSRITEVSVASGEATAGSTTTLEDTGAAWPVNYWVSSIVEIIHNSTHYFVTVTSNTVDTITFDAIAEAIAEDDPYYVRMSLRLSDIDKWGGANLTSRDISLDLKALTDDSIKGILKTLGDIAALENLITRIGQTSDAMVAAGAVGSMAAKLRRLTNDLSALLTAVGLLPQLATTPVIYNKTMTLADTQYSQALPANTKKYTIQTRDGTEFRMAFVTGKVAAPTEPYFTIGADGFHHEDLINPAALTLYFACGSAGKVAEILVWS